MQTRSEKWTASPPRGKTPVRTQRPVTAPGPQIRMPSMPNSPDPAQTHPPARIAIDLLQTPACLLDESGALTHLNPAWQRMAGRPAEEPATHLSWGSLISPVHLDNFLPRLPEVSAERIYTTFEVQLLDAGGPPRWHHLGLHPISTSTAQQSWICVATDIHALKVRETVLEQRAALRSRMLDLSLDCIKVITPEGNLVHMNQAGCQALGLEENSGFGMPWIPLLPDDSHADGERALELARDGQTGRFKGRSLSGVKGEQFWDNMLTPVFDALGEVATILCVSRDVTAEQKALRDLRENMERLAIATKLGGLGIWDYDIVNDRLHCDDTWYRIMGRDPARPIVSLTDFRPFLHPDDVERATEVTNTAAELIASETDYSITFRIIHPNGDVRWVRSLAYLHHDEGVPTRAIGMVADITDSWRGELALRDANRALEEEMSTLARKVLEDPLTGIANRRHLDSEFTRLWMRANEDRLPLCVGMLDVDHFKAFNDRYGHIQGDVALRRIARVLQSATRQSDLLARYGGEEFAFVLVGTDDASHTVERFRQAVADLRIPHADSLTGFLTISCGVVTAVPPRYSPRQMLQASDEALYAAKQSGRNCYVLRSLTP